MNRLSCPGKGFIRCYIQHYKFFVFSTTLFCILLIVALMHALFFSATQHDQIVANYVRIAVLKKR